MKTPQISSEVKELEAFEAQQRQNLEQSRQKLNDYVSKVEKDFSEMLSDEKQKLESLLNKKVQSAQNKALEQLDKQNAQFKRHKVALNAIYSENLDAAVNEVAKKFFN